MAYQQANAQKTSLNTSEIITSIDTLKLKSMYGGEGVRLVLSGGGSRGLAHIGVLRALEEANITIASITGTSIGAIIGGLYASGYSVDQIEEIASETDWEEIFSFRTAFDRADKELGDRQVFDRYQVKLDFDGVRFQPPRSFSPGTKYTSFVQTLIWNAPMKTTTGFNTLQIPFAAVASDLTTGTSVTLREGSLASALRMSGNVPLRYSPIPYGENSYLIDGGIMANLPTRESLIMPGDLTLAVDCTSPLLPPDDLANPLNIASQLISIAMKTMSDSAGKYADFVIRPTLGDRDNFDFSSQEEVVEAGYKEAKEKIELIKAYFRSQRNSLRLETIKNLSGRSVADIESISIVGAIEPHRESLQRLVDAPDMPPVVKLSAFLDSVRVYSDIYDEIDYIEETNAFVFVPRPFIGDIYAEWRGTTVTSDAFVESFDSLKNAFSGLRYTEENIKMLRKGILSALRESGMDFGNILDISVIPRSDNNVNLGIELIAGALGKVIITGNDRTSDLFIIRELYIEKGDIITVGSLEKSWESLHNSEYFNQVVLVPEFDPLSNHIDLRVSLAEKGREYFFLGGGVDNERIVQGGAELGSRNILETGTDFSLGFMGGVRDKELFVSLQNRQIPYIRFGLSLDGYYDERDVYNYTAQALEQRDQYLNRRNGEYTEERMGVVASLFTQLETFGRVSMDYRLEKQRWYTIERPLEGDSVTNSFSLLGLFGLSSVIDNRNDLYFPTEGSYLMLRYESSFFKLGDLSFSRFMAIGSQNITFDRHTFEPGFGFGVGDATMPFMEYFSLGGINSFYGMREDERRGRQYMSASMAYRYKIPIVDLLDIYLHARYDLGEIWSRPESIKFENLKHGIGFGVGMNTPLGPAEASLGRRFYFLKDPNEVVTGPWLAYIQLGVRM